MKASSPLEVEHYQEQAIEYFLNLPIWPEFDIHNKQIDGLIPSCRVNSWEEFDQVVKHYCENDLDGNYVFRGQKHYQWQLEPTLDRLVKGAVKADLAAKHLSNFRFSTRGRLNDKSILDKDSELWALGQHHGLATPLLDWSLSPYVALFFAFEGEDDATWFDDNGDCNNYSRTIFILNKVFIQDLGFDDLEPDGTSLKIVEPSIDDHGRLVNQAGLFSLAPYGETLESSLYTHLTDSGVDVDDVEKVSKYICRIHIPNKPDTRFSCLKKLRKMNIHHASLFPDLIGSSGYCNDLIRDVINSSMNKSESVQVEKTAEEIIKETHASSPWAMHKLPKDVTGLLLQALIVDGSLKAKTNPNNLSKVVDELIDFINEKAGVDWYKKDSMLARLRNIVRRSLRRQQFPDDFIDVATEALISKSAAMSADVESMASKGIK
ncbi:FRG domain-containing protein [Psychrobacter fozii]|uniref:FRG domain-containing protein n=1 Tax=Psychrobacter fozii TaxID=198480 RepID=UPI00191A9BD7|nr:FRG domain-containing protein [Psychrobacter fozii]